MSEDSNDYLAELEGDTQAPERPGVSGSRDLRSRYKAMIEQLRYDQETHRQWRDWLAGDPERQKENPDIGSPAFHDRTVKDYEERIYLMEVALDLLERQKEHPHNLLMDSEGSDD